MDSYSSDLHLNNSGGGAIDGSPLAKIFSNSKQALNEVNSILDLKAGDVFKGQIASIKGENVLILLDNGQQMNARIDGKVLLSSGQNLSFEVQSNEQNKVIIKPVTQNLTQTQDAVLKAASLPINPKSVALVDSMLENGISVEKNNLSNMYRATLNFPDTSLQTLSMLSKMQISITKDNINQYENYKNLEYKITDSIDDIVSDVDNVFQKLPSEKRQAFLEEVMNSFDFEIKTQPKENTNENKQTVLMGNEPKQTSDDVKNNTVSEPKILMEQAEVKNVDANIPQTIVKEKNMTNVSYDVKEEVTQTTPDNEKTTTFIDKTKITNDNSNGKETVPLEKNIPSEKQSFQQAGRNENIKPEQSILQNSVNKNTKPEQSVFETILKEEKPESKLKSILKNELQKNWTLEPKEVALKENVQKLYTRVRKQAADIQNTLDKYAKESGESAPKSASSLQKNLNFMEQLEQVFTYVQLPLKFSEGKAHGELCVYTNKKNLARNDGNLSAFLHLDMTNLGSTDIKLELQTKDNRLKCDFFLQEDSLILVSQHIEELNAALKKEGYTIKTTVNPYEDDRPSIEKMEETAGLKMTKLSYQNFDMRA